MKIPKQEYTTEFKELAVKPHQGWPNDRRGGEGFGADRAQGCNAFKLLSP